MCSRPSKRHVDGAIGKVTWPPDELRIASALLNNHAFTGDGCLNSIWTQISAVGLEWGVTVARLMFGALQAGIEPSPVKELRTVSKTPPNVGKTLSFPKEATVS